MMRALILAALVCVAPLSVAQQDMDLYEQALTASAQGDEETAAIHLKNALQENPMHVPSRILLGQLYLKNGEPEAAEKELRRSLDLDADPNLVLIPLGYSLLLLENYNAIIDYELPRVTTQDVRTEWSMILGRALLGANRNSDAYTVFDGLLKNSPDDIGAMLGQANARFAQQQWVDAESICDAVLRIDPTVPSAWKIKGDIARLSEQADRAIEFYTKTLEHDPSNFAALKDRALLLIGRGEQERALADIEALREELPNDPGTVLINSWLLALSKKNEEAQQMLDDLGQKLDRLDENFVARNAQIQLAKGVAYFLQGRTQEALPLLDEFLEKQPYHVGARLLLARIASDRGQTERIVRLLEPIASGLSDEPELLGAYLRGLIALGRADEALDLGNELYLANPDSLPVAQLYAGILAYLDQIDNAIDVLTQGEETTVTQRSGLMLGYLLLAQNQLPAALSTAEQLLAAYPESGEVANFAGATFLRIGDLDNAEAVLDEALALDADSLPIRLNRAYLSLRQGDPETARAAFVRLAEQYPLETQAVKALSDIDSRNGNTPAAIEWTETLARLEPGNFSHKFRLAGLHLREGNARQTLDYVNDLEREFPLDERLVELKVRAYVLDRDTDQARRWLDFLYGSNSSNPQKIATIFGLQLAINDVDGAKRSVERLQTIAPHTLETQLLSARFELGTRELDNAISRLQRLETAHKDNVQVYELLADAYSRRGDISKFRDYYERAQAIDPSAQRVRQASGRLWQAGERELASEMLASWIQGDPDDNASRQVYAQVLLGLERSTEAYEVYKALLEDDPALLTVASYNNLAYLALDLEPERAFEFATQAHDMEPGNPAVADTLAWVLIRQGEPDKALPLLREAYSRASRNPSVKYHMAAALIALDRKEDALPLLKDLLRSDKDFPDRDAAQQLLAEATGQGVDS